MIIYRKTINQDKKIFKYLDKKNNEIKDKTILAYINNMQPIPPAYDFVEIFYEKSPKILFQGRDTKGKLQQIYSPKWREKADKEKFKALIEFGHALPMINLQILKNIKSNVLTKDKIISIILRIITLCGFRVGQLKYQKIYGSIGLSTLMLKHLTFKKDTIVIKFPGKKGVENNCIITDPLIINELKKIAENKQPKDFLFQYTENGETQIINAIDINIWLKQYNKEFTSKYFRTFSVNVMLIDLLKTVNPTKLTESQRKKKIIEIIKNVSCSINNSPAICKKSYLNPDLVKQFIEFPRTYENNINKNTDSSIVNFIRFLDKK